MNPMYENKDNKEPIKWGWEKPLVATILIKELEELINASNRPIRNPNCSGYFGR